MDEHAPVTGIDKQLQENYLRALWATMDGAYPYTLFSTIAPVIREGLEHMSRAKIIAALYDLRSLTRDG